jgi:hypothetical protein
MKLAEHVDKIRKLIDTAFRNRLGRMGIREQSLALIDDVLAEYRVDRERVEAIYETLLAETNNKAKDAYEKLVEEFTFTLFNRLAALKVMEAHTLHAEIVTRRTQHGGRSFAHLAWLEQNPDKRNEELEGLVGFLESQLQQLSEEINLFSLDYPYHLLPTAIELNQIIDTFNAVDEDGDVEENIWQSDDVMGWLYESYNNYKKIAHKESGDKTEYDKVPIQSQVYTPRWVVKFLVDNSLGKLYLEMYTHSTIKAKYQIANAPTEQIRQVKPLTEIKLIDPACGSANFLLYAFDLFYDLYLDQIENYGADYDELKVPELIIHNNLHGIDLDDRAVQLAQLGLYIKAKRRRRTAKIEHFNVVSSDFFLPDFDEVREMFETEAPLRPELEKIVRELWAELQQAHKYGALLRIEEKFRLELHGVIEEAKGFSLRIISLETLAEYETFRENFFAVLQKAVSEHSRKFGSSFLSVKTADAITFLELLTQKYDVAVANPPYTDSGDFGGELKTFIETNYKTAYKFNTNLYATFIKRCADLTNENGKLGLIHPLTFMYIKSFEDVRKFILDKLHINIFVDYGLSNLFGAVMVDPAFYVLEKEISSQEPTLFISLDQYTRTPNEKFKKDFCLTALDNHVSGNSDKHNYAIDQSILKIIKGWPFIYWISDEFRKKFDGRDALDRKAKVAYGVKTGNNDGALRFWWEVDRKEIYGPGNSAKKWVLYTKGGPFRRWHGNIWLCVNWANNAAFIKRQNSYNLPPEGCFFVDGISWPDSGTKGICFRYVSDNILYDKGSSIVIPSGDLMFTLAVLNSSLVFYIADCLNPTVSKMPNDIKRIPLPDPSRSDVDYLRPLAYRCVQIRRALEKYSPIEFHFEESPLLHPSQTDLSGKVKNFLTYENHLLTQVLINEAIINDKVFEVYELTKSDRKRVIEKEGQSIASFPVCVDARDAYLAFEQIEDEFSLTEVRWFIDDLPVEDFDDEKRTSIESGFAALYQSNNDLEEFCIRHQVNPINVWYWFKQSSVVPQGRGQEIALEFLADITRTVLMEDEDGIIPLVSLPGEPAMIDRLEQKCLSLGLTSAQFAQLDDLLGRPVKDYLEHYFFQKLSDHLNLFMYLPKTPFIWHLSSGEHQGFEAYIIIYKWTRDSLYKLKTTYIARREEALQYRLSQIADSDTAQAQTEKDKIRTQLQEISDFTKKVDELIAEGYDPKLDDGVGKNIAPLQKKGMLRADVLNAKQLEKYLNADW